MKIKKIFEYEKKNMNSMRWKINYILVPIFFLIMGIILLVNCIMLSMDEKKYTPFAIGLFLIYGLMCMGMLVITPFVRKVELKIEMSKYNFDRITLGSDSFFEFVPISGTEANIVVLFQEHCLKLYDKEYNYCDFNVRLCSSNHLNKINLFIVFTLHNSDTAYNPYLSFILEGRLITVLERFNIVIENQDELEYIIKNKENAFKQIYNYGYVKTINISSVV